MTTPRIRLSTYWKPLVAVAALGAMIVYAGGFLHKKTPPDQLAISAGEPIPAGSVIQEVRATPHAPRIDVVGTTTSDRRIQLSARIGGYVQDVTVVAGDPVKAGQTLVVLDDREIREQLAAAESQLAQASAEQRRAQQLFERQATTEQALTAAESAFQTARANVERTKVMLSYATVTAPMDGIVAERNIEVGDLANPGQLLLSMFDPTNMRIEVPVPVRLVHQFQLGQTREVALEFPNRTFKAEVTEIVGQIDPQSRTRRVKLRLLDAASEVLPGSFGRVWVEDAPRPALLVPAAALFQVGQLDMVHVALDDQRMSRRMVKTGARIGDQVDIVSGLADGTRIVLPAAGAP